MKKTPPSLTRSISQVEKDKILDLYHKQQTQKSIDERIDMFLGGLEGYQPDVSDPTLKFSSALYFEGHESYLKNVNFPFDLVLKRGLPDYALSMSQLLYLDKSLSQDIVRQTFTGTSRDAGRLYSRGFSLTSEVTSKSTIHYFYRAGFPQYETRLAFGSPTASLWMSSDIYEILRLNKSSERQMLLKKMAHLQPQSLRSPCSIIFDLPPEHYEAIKSSKDRISFYNNHNIQPYAQNIVSRDPLTVALVNGAIDSSFLILNSGASFFPQEDVLPDVLKGIILSFISTWEKRLNIQYQNPWKDHWSKVKQISFEKYFLYSPEQSIEDVQKDVSCFYQQAKLFDHIMSQTSSDMMLKSLEQLKKQVKNKKYHFNTNLPCVSCHLNQTNNFEGPEPVFEIINVFEQWVKKKQEKTHAAAPSLIHDVENWSDIISIRQKQLESYKKKREKKIESHDVLPKINTKQFEHLNQEKSSGQMSIKDEFYVFSEKERDRVREVGGLKAFFEIAERHYQSVVENNQHGFLLNHKKEMELFQRKLIGLYQNRSSLIKPQEEEDFHHLWLQIYMNSFISQMPSGTASSIYSGHAHAEPATLKKLYPYFNFILAQPNLIQTLIQPMRSLSYHHQKNSHARDQRNMFHYVLEAGNLLGQSIFNFSEKHPTLSNFLNIEKTNWKKMVFQDENSDEPHQISYYDFLSSLFTVMRISLKDHRDADNTFLNLYLGMKKNVESVQPEPSWINLYLFLHRLSVCFSQMGSIRRVFVGKGMEKYEAFIIENFLLNLSQEAQKKLNLTGDKVFGNTTLSSYLLNTSSPRFDYYKDIFETVEAIYQRNTIFKSIEEAQSFESGSEILRVQSARKKM